MKKHPFPINRTLIIFFIIALVWIIVTDYALFYFARNLRDYHNQILIKEILFIVIITSAIYFIIRRNHAFFEQRHDALNFSYEELAVIIPETNLGIARLGSKGEFLYVNPFLCALTGYQPSDFLNRHYSVFLKPEDNNEIAYWDSLLMQGKLPRMKNIACVTCKNGNKLICNLSVITFLINSDVEKLIVIVENITNSRKEQKILEESLKRYQILSMSTMEGLWDYNLLTGQLYYNSNIKFLFGYDDEELQPGFSWWKDNIHPEDKEKILDKMEAALKISSVSSTQNEYRFRCKDGSYKIITDFFSILRDSLGNAFRVLVSMHDVTEQRHLQQQLAEKETVYQRQLARTVLDTQENERKKLAEELHDNVNQLLGVAKLYIEHAISNEQIRDGLLRKSNEYIDKVISELRTLSKTLAPPLLAELGLEHSLSSMAETIEEVQPITIRIDLVQFDESKLLEGQKLMLYRVVQEQLNNIIKHAQASDVTVHLEQVENKVMLTITDDGKGADLANEDNKGIGLRNIRNRIELYQGTMNLETAPGKGFILNVEFDLE
ncbi:MAG: PAS domain S-box protein [Chitinophagaceae bacterium]|nr:PAS domain S-box protein [Chitinophagaceae bacterium]